jgi:MFS family permease
MGIYGLTQGLLQLPFGMASDRLGRKRVIVFGLLVFAAGSALAPYTQLNCIGHTNGNASLATHKCLVNGTTYTTACAG